jgi:hypothetical protein
MTGTYPADSEEALGRREDRPPSGPLDDRDLFAGHISERVRSQHHRPRNRVVS